jgi:transcriptional regulator with XRE-family HTH domain
MSRRNMGNGNPYTRARVAAKMTIPDLARATGLSFTAIWTTEQALIASPNPRIAETLAQVGVDVAGIEAEYAKFRAAESKETIRRFAAAAGARG